MNNMNAIGRVADLVREADGLLIMAGAGIGVDSGLPDVRGDQGCGRLIWRSANPDSFSGHPRLVRGFYGHRLQLYRTTAPRECSHILRRIGTSMANGAFVYTTNVDGQFQKAGFDDAQIAGYHGSIHRLMRQTGIFSQGCAVGRHAILLFDPRAAEYLLPHGVYFRPGGLTRP